MHPHTHVNMFSQSYHKWDNFIICQTKISVALLLSDSYSEDAILNLEFSISCIMTKVLVLAIYYLPYTEW